MALASAASGRQLVRASLPFPNGLLKEGQTLTVSDGQQEFEAALRPLTWHASSDSSPRFVRRALVTFPYHFPDEELIRFGLRATSATKREPVSLPVEIQLVQDTVIIDYGTGPTLKAHLVAPPRGQAGQAHNETVESNNCFYWQKTRFPDSEWPRVIEVRTDTLGCVVLIAHLQRSLPGNGYAPEFGWRVEVEDSEGHLKLSDQQLPVRQEPLVHHFSDGQPCALVFDNGRYQIYHPAAPLKRKGQVAISHQSNNGWVYRYLRSIGTDKVPMQQAAWRRAELVIAPVELAQLTRTLQSPHRVQVNWTLWDDLYSIGPPPDLQDQPELEALVQYHRDAIVRSMAVGDDWGNVTNYSDSSASGGVHGMNRLNHCPAIFFEAIRSNDNRLIETALLWCDNFHDLSIWWGPERTGGTRYNNIVAQGETTPDNDRTFMWRSNDAVTFCTKGYDSFFLAYEQTGDPRMLEALEAQIRHAAKYVHTNDGECRNIGDVLDFVRLYRFTGNQQYLKEALRLFRELRTKLSQDNLFSQSGKPIVANPPFMDNDERGYHHPFAKPYIIGYALAGLPELAAHAPAEPKLRGVIQAVADFLAESQDPIGAWRYPHPRSSRALAGQAIEHAWQLVQADRFLGAEQSHLDAVERVLRQRIWGWKKTGRIFSSLNGWEVTRGKVKESAELHELYRYPEDRDYSRDYVDGRPTFGSCSPEGLVYLPDVLAYYLRHRPAARLLRPPPEGKPLHKVLEKDQGGSQRQAENYQHGLVGICYDSIDLTKPIARLELASMDLNDLDPVNRNDWSMRCQGHVEAPHTGKVRFFAEADDGIRLSIDGKTIIDGWGLQGQRSGQIVMSKGQRYPVVISYYQDGGPCYMRLYWAWRGQEKTVVASDALFHLDSDVAVIQDMYRLVVASSQKVITTAFNPAPDVLPTLEVWQRDKEILVASTFPNIPNFRCDSWCYESHVEFVGAKGLDWGRLQLRHRLQEHPHVHIVTTVTPEPGAVEFAAQIETDEAAGGQLPESILTPNLCWQLRRAPDFASSPDPYPEFVKRCFIFTDKGMTFLDETIRRKIPCRSENDPYNNPPWVQMYVGTWQKVPQSRADSWSDYSPAQYTTTVIGAVSRDRKYLAALANDSATLMCQAWHDCMHDNPQWLPADAPVDQRRWRLRIYAMENDPQALLTRVAEDFPAARAQPAMSKFKIRAETKTDQDVKARFAEIFQTRGVQDDLPAFLPRLAARLTFPQSWQSGQYSDYGAWRKEARQTVRRCWLAAPPDAPYDPVVIAEQDRGSYLARKVVFNLTADSRVLGYMLVPKGKGPFPAALLLHDHGARFDIGKEKVIRPWDVPSERLASAREWVSLYYGGRFIGDELAKRGYVCFCTDALNWSDRGGAGYKGQQALASNLLHMGMSLAGLIAYEDLRAAEFLATQPEVDTKHVAAMGLSMGSFRTWQIAAMSDHIAAGVAVCWMTTVKGLMVPGNNQIRGQSAYTMTHPGLFNYLDYPDVASIACPKPMLFYNGQNDHLFPVPSVKEAYDKMRKVWESQKAGDRLVTKLWPVAHEFNRQMQAEAFAWLDQQFKPEVK
ncbi:MAG: PA14 domain-containing protein [Planctomycetota bacterium]